MSRFSKLPLVLLIVLFTALSLSFHARAEPIIEAVRGVERDLNARVGFYMHDMQTDETVVHSANQRFPLNSTFKLLACGALLRQVDKGTTDLSEEVQLKQIDIVTYSPAIKIHIDAGKTEVSLATACQMMLSVSDNTAANIVLSSIGGPEGLTRFFRSIGDDVSRLDRWEPELNEAVPNDLQDTTTPKSIAHSLRRVLLGDVLSTRSQVKLREWLADHRVADDLFRAALPSDWSIDDRTGAGGFGSRSIIAVIYPPDRKPILATFFMTETDASFAQRNKAAARIGTAIVQHILGK